MSEALRVDEEQEQDEGFVVLDDTSAEWSVRMIEECEAEIEKWDTFYAAHMARIREQYQRKIDFFKSKLQEYFALVPHKVTKTQESYQLPSGKLVLKGNQRKYTPDDDALVPWLEKNRPELVRVRKSANWLELKKTVQLTPEGTGVMTEDGEVIPGVKVEALPDAFSVQFK